MWQSGTEAEGCLISVLFPLHPAASWKHMERHVWLQTLGGVTEQVMSSWQHGGLSGMQLVWGLRGLVLAGSLKEKARS